MIVVVGALCLLLAMMAGNASLRQALVLHGREIML